MEGHIDSAHGKIIHDGIGHGDMDDLRTYDGGLFLYNLFPSCRLFRFSLFLSSGFDS